MASLLSKSYPWPTTTCGDLKCFPCSSTMPGRQPKKSCRTPGISYQISCLICKESGKDSTYQGESGRNGHTRGAEHQRDLRNKIKTSPLYSHQQANHPGESARFHMEVLGTFKDALSRQIEEASRIEACNNPLTMNSRSEWRSTPLPQLGVTQGRVQQGTAPTYHQGPTPTYTPRVPQPAAAHDQQGVQVPQTDAEMVK